MVETLHCLLRKTSKQRVYKTKVFPPSEFISVSVWEPLFCVRDVEIQFSIKQSRKVFYPVNLRLWRPENALRCPQGLYRPSQRPQKNDFLQIQQLSAVQGFHTEGQATGPHHSLDIELWSTPKIRNCNLWKVYSRLWTTNPTRTTEARFQPTTNAWPRKPKVR